MAEIHNDKKPRHTEEPKISEIEKLIRIFQDAHGHEKLMEIIKPFTDFNHKNTNPKKKYAHQDQELKITELENLFKDFKKEFGHEKLMSFLKEVTDDIHKKHKTASTQDHEIYITEEQKNPVNLKNEDFFELLKNILTQVIRLFKNIKKIMAKKRYRYPVLAFSLFMSIYILFNLPVIYSRISWHKPDNTQKLVVTTQEVVQQKMADSAALAPGEVIPNQSTIVIPKINVSAPIVYSDTTDENKVHDELHNGVVHYAGTAMPGEVGNSFITGHSSNYWWDTGKFNYVFVNLDRLVPGDQAIVYYNGKKFVYTVKDKIVVEPTDMSVLASTDTPVLSLMTCTPPGTSWKRLVVHLDRTDPVYYKPQTITKKKVVAVPKPKEENKGFFSKVLSLVIPN